MGNIQDIQVAGTAFLNIQVLKLDTEIKYICKLYDLLRKLWKQTLSLFAI